MIAKPLSKNGTVGLCSPCLIADKYEYSLISFQLRMMGFKVKEADNLYSSSYGYGASPEEKAADFMQLINDDEVELILFGGGEGCNEILPLLDFERIKEKPKRICAFSDATTLLNSIWAKTGLEVYYGLSSSDFGMELDEYKRAHFEGHILSDNMTEHLASSPWIACNGGIGEGILFGGYLRNVALMLDNRYFPIDRSKDYILLAEDHEQFGGIDYVSALLAHIEQHNLINNIKGIIFGQYSAARQPLLYDRLKRLGKAHDIPVIYCDDFGHGDTASVFPIGHKVRLDANEGKLTYI